MKTQVTDEEYVEALYEQLLLRCADESGKRFYMTLLASGRSRFDVMRDIATSAECFELLCKQRFGPQTGSPFLAAAAPGHFYSPLPSLDAVERLGLTSTSFDLAAFPEIDLRVDQQLTLLSQLAPYARALVIADGRCGDRYYADNGSFAPGDATLLAAMIRHMQPSTILEVGAGFSTAMMLDTVERYLPDRCSIEAIDPEPQRAMDLLRATDVSWLTLRAGLVQDMPISTFTRLGKNDILFIDSSHVMKLGSDVAFLFNQVLPVLAPGVVVHVHDVAWPFEYPVDHYRHGWAWNEAQCLRLLLANSARYEVLLFADYLARARRPEVRAIMPEALRQRPGVPPEGNSACSFWFRVRED